VTVIENACRAIDTAGSRDQARADMAKACGSCPTARFKPPTVHVEFDDRSPIADAAVCLICIKAPD